MFDLKWIRENPDALDGSLKRRGADAASAAILKLDSERRGVQTRLQEMQNRRNAASKEIGKAMGEGRSDEAEALKQEVGDLKEAIQEAEQAERDLSGSRCRQLLEGLPNILDDGTSPMATSEDDNEEVRRVGTPPEFCLRAARTLSNSARRFGLMDFDAAGKLERFALRCAEGGVGAPGAGARPVHARCADHRVRLHRGQPAACWCATTALYGTGQLPKFADDLFRTTRGPLAYPHRRSAADQHGCRQHHRRGQPADPRDRAHRRVSAPRPALPVRTHAACCGSISSTRWSWSRWSNPTARTRSSSA